MKGQKYSRDVFNKATQVSGDLGMLTVSKS